MSREELIIVGGGISGLMAAKAALDRGEKNVRVLEGDKKRVGGKLITFEIDGQKVNGGAEFIDEENTGIRKLAAELGVKLIPTGEQSTELFQSPSGKMMPNFLQQYAPIAKQIARIRDAMEKDPALAERMKSTSAQELIAELGKTVPVSENRGLLQRIGDSLYNAAMIVTFQSSRANRVPQEVLDTALNAMQKELGATSNHITAAQFMSETSPSEDRFLTSTCDYRVEGGTESLVVALKHHLEQRGVQFEMGHQLQSLQKDGDDKVLTFATEGGEKTVRSKNVIMALPAYALSKVKGLEFLGLADNPVQYTKNAKLTVKVKPGVKLPSGDANAFLAGSECWSPDEGLLTFLCHNENADKPEVVINNALQSYAAAFGMKAEDLFYIENGKPVAGSFAYSNPGKAPCWSTPSPENAHQMEQLFAKMESLAGQGLGFVGTYIPLPDGGVGFMECGAASVERVCGRMFGQGRGKEQEVALSHEKQTPHHSFTASVDASRSGSNKGMAL